MPRQCYEFNFTFLCLQVFLQIKVKLYVQILYLLVFQKPILAERIYKQVLDLMMILISQAMSQTTMKQQKKKSTERDNTEEPLSSNSTVETKFHCDFNVEQTIPQPTRNFFISEGKTTREDRERYQSIVLLFFFSDEILNHITFQTNLYINEISHLRGTKPASPVSREEIEKLFRIILFMGTEKFPNKRRLWNPVTLSKYQNPT